MLQFSRRYVIRGKKYFSARATQTREISWANFVRAYLLTHFPGLAAVSSVSPRMHSVSRAARTKISAISESHRWILSYTVSGKVPSDSQTAGLSVNSGLIIRTPGSLQSKSGVRRQVTPLEQPLRICARVNPTYVSIR